MTLRITLAGYTHSESNGNRMDSAPFGHRGSKIQNIVGLVKAAVGIVMDTAGKNLFIYL
ncbi:MAG: hypothetical protein QOK41_1148 [Sphingomonadales bacterium]|jgi:hypothetical protein|nr:hypothetical protein [Sphingomonadales bacterium]